MSDDQVERFASLFPHERSALVDALRRDADALLLRAATDSENSTYYLFNHQVVTRLIEILNPQSYS